MTLSCTLVLHSRISMTTYAWTHRKWWTISSPVAMKSWKFELISKPTGKFEFSKSFTTKVTWMSILCPIESVDTVPFLSAWKYWKLRDDFEPDGQLDSIAPKARSNPTAVGVEIILNFSKFSCRQGRNCPHSRWDSVSLGSKYSWSGPHEYRCWSCFGCDQSRARLPDPPKRCAASATSEPNDVDLGGHTRLHYDELQASKWGGTRGMLKWVHA